MLIKHNYLRMYRKRFQLEQTDVAFILNLSDHTSISRWENGERIPTIETLLMYHLLFGVHIESFFERQAHELTGYMAERLMMRIRDLQDNDPLEDTSHRVAFFTEAFKRLTGVEAPL